MISLLQVVMERGREETEGPSQAGDVLVAWPTPWPALRRVGGPGPREAAQEG